MQVYYFEQSLKLLALAQEMLLTFGQHETRNALHKSELTRYSGVAEVSAFSAMLPSEREDMRKEARVQRHEARLGRDKGPSPNQSKSCHVLSPKLLINTWSALPRTIAQSI